MSSLVEDYVSVIIPAYNSERFIKRAIDSVLNQTYQNFELIVVDDFSSDETLNYILEYSENDKVVIKSLNKNSGVASARNFGLQLSRGQYIAFLDSDDWWEEQHIELLLSDLKANSGASLSYSTFKIFDESENKINTSKFFFKNHKYRHQLFSTFIFTSSVLIDRKITGNFSFPLLDRGQDYALWLRLLKLGNATGSNNLTLNYTSRSMSLSSNKLNNIKEVWTIQKEIENISRLPRLLNISIYIIISLIKSSHLITRLNLFR